MDIHEVESNMALCSEGEVAGDGLALLQWNIGEMTTQGEDGIQCAREDNRIRARVPPVSETDIQMCELLLGVVCGQPKVLIGLLEATAVEEGIETVHSLPETIQQVICQIARGEDKLSNRDNR